MTDYGQDLQFGIFPSPDAAAADLSSSSARPPTWPGSTW